MLITYIENRYPTDYISSIWDNYLSSSLIDGKSVRFSLCDTQASDEYTRIRILAYPETNVILLVFSIGSPNSYANIRDIKVPEIKQHCPNVPFLLVGAQSDRRENREVIENLAKKGLAPITFEQGQQLAKEIGAVKYIECSAFTGEGLKEVFEEAIRLGVFNQTNYKMYDSVRTGNKNEVRNLLKIEPKLIKGDYLYIAAKYQHKEIYTLLLEKGAQRKNELSLAVKDNSLDAIKFLLEAGIDTNISKHEEEAAGHCCKNKNYAKLVITVL